MVRQFFPQVRLIQNQKNVGFARANNQAISQACGRYILLLNSDTVILDNAITRTVRYLDEHCDIGIMGCRVLNPDRTLQRTCFQYPSLLNMLLSTTYLYKIFPKSKFLGRERMTWWDRCDERPVDVVTGCYMLVRKAVVEQIGMLDETYFMYGEETDWCYRAKMRGWKVGFAPVGQIIHLGGASSKQIKPEMVLQLRGSILKFIQKNKGVIPYMIACVLTSLFFLIRVPYWFFYGLIHRGHSFRTCQTYLSGAVRSLGGYAYLIHK
jgi:GT2 family glycosyltransferase